MNRDPESLTLKMVPKWLEQLTGEMWDKPVVHVVVVAVTRNPDGSPSTFTTHMHGTAPNTFEFMALTGAMDTVHAKLVQMYWQTIAQMQQANQPQILRPQ